MRYSLNRKWLQKSFKNEQEALRNPNWIITQWRKKPIKMNVNYNMRMSIPPERMHYVVRCETINHFTMKQRTFSWCFAFYFPLIFFRFECFFLEISLQFCLICLTLNSTSCSFFPRLESFVQNWLIIIGISSELIINSFRQKIRRNFRIILQTEISLCVQFFRRE